MLRYTLVFLLVNIYGRSLGVPVKDSTNGNFFVGSLLRELSRQCKNEFVLGQIANKNNACNVQLPPYRDVNLQCLLFFDANRLMCNHTAINNADLSTELTAKLSEKQGVSAFCSEAAHFNVPSTTYQTIITTVFQNDVACKKVCTDDDILTGDTNFFCKYYKWTLQKVNAPLSSTDALKPTVNPVSSGASGPVEEKNNSTATQVSHVSDGQLKTSSDRAASVTKVQSEKEDETNQHPSEVAKQESSSVAQLPSIQNQESSKLQSEGDSTIKKSLQETVHTQEVGEKDGDIEKPNVDVEAIDGGNIEAGIDNNLVGKDPDVAIPQIETQGQKIGVDNEDPDDASMDMENDDGKEANMDNADEGDDQIGNDMEVKIEQDSKNSAKRIETQVSLNGDGSQREFFQSPDGFAEADDHFFPFFLTAVIVVAVLYVLYHNKSKVGKMFFGLIVEGRQTGRRRNSRGHAYRRLDTLEQAMSTNTTAPPSKIIY